MSIEKSLQKTTKKRRRFINAILTFSLVLFVGLCGVFGKFVPTLVVSADELILQNLSISSFDDLSGKTIYCDDSSTLSLSLSGTYGLSFGYPNSSPLITYNGTNYYSFVTYTLYSNFSLFCASSYQLNNWDYAGGSSLLWYKVSNNPKWTIGIDYITFVDFGDNVVSLYQRVDNDNRQVLVTDNSIISTYINFINNNFYEYVSPPPQPTLIEQIIDLLTSGISALAVSLGSGLQALVIYIFVDTSGEVFKLTTFGSIVCVFMGVSLAIALCRYLILWLTSMGES